MHVTVIGAGPAGSSAALSALREGAEVSIFEKSKFPRHKVCGEFLSPEAQALLDELGIWRECEACQPATLRRVFLSIGKHTKSWKLSEAARGLSRYAMDHVLLQGAITRGASFHREAATAAPGAVLAYGRQSRGPAGNRLFGFKAHFQGPSDDVMSLFFFQGSYVGVNAVEGGVTNVCGVASEADLGRNGFRIDEYIQSCQPLCERIQPLTRTMEWLTTGPLVFGVANQAESCYAAGDSAAFVDPFTGSGMLGAISSGILAGRAAAHATLPEAHRKRWCAIIGGQQRSAQLLRTALDFGVAERLLPFVPGRALFYATRPSRISVAYT